MKAIIEGIEQDLKLTSHILESDPFNPSMFLMFHCWKCGKSLFQFSGNVIMTVPGETPTTLPIIYMCRTCKQRHLINSIL